MDRKEVLMIAWEVANERDDWFAAIRKALENVDAEQAAWKPSGISGFNSIQEIVHHLLYYKARFLSRLTGTDFETAVDNEATFVTGFSMEWEKVRQELFVTNKKNYRTPASIARCRS